MHIRLHFFGHTFKLNLNVSRNYSQRASAKRRAVQRVRRRRRAPFAVLAQLLRMVLCGNGSPQGLRDMLPLRRSYPPRRHRIHCHPWIVVTFFKLG